MPSDYAMLRSVLVVTALSGIASGCHRVPKRRAAADRERWASLEEQNHE
jgi:hypothetical protein